MPISLLPKSQRDKEEEEKQKTKEGMGLPDFKMHLPEKKDEVQKAEVKQETEEWIKLEGQELAPKKKRGIFRLKQKEKPTPPPPPPKVVADPQRSRGERPVPPAPPKIKMPALSPPPKVETPLPPPPPEKKSNKGLKMRFPQDERELNGTGKKIIQETSDKVERARKSKPLADYFKKGLAVLRFKKPPAEVNLISEDYQEVVLGQFWLRVKYILILVLVFVLLFSGAYFGIKFYKKDLVKEYNDLDGLISQTQAEINLYGTGKLQVQKLKERAKVLQILLKNHIYWTEFLTELEHNTVENVYYTGITAEDTGKIVLSAKAKNYTDVARQLAVFQEADFVELVDLNAASKAAPEVFESEFDLELGIEEPEEPVALDTMVSFDINLQLVPVALLKSKE